MNTQINLLVDKARIGIGETKMRIMLLQSTTVASAIAIKFDIKNNKGTWGK
jgi:hypothetical protein